MKKNITNYSGSAVLIVILLMTAVFFSCFNLWKSAALTIDLALKRQERAQKIKIAEGILNYGISLCVERFEHLESCEKNTSWSIDTGKWEITENVNYYGNLRITLEEKVLKLNATVFDDAKTVVSEASCIVARNKQQTKKVNEFYFIIRDWKL